MPTNLYRTVIGAQTTLGDASAVTLGGPGISIPFTTNDTTNYNFVLTLTGSGGIPVTVRAEGTNDNLLAPTPANWFNLDAGGANTTYSADGTYSLFGVGRAVKNVRLNYLSGTGTISFTVGGSS